MVRLQRVTFLALHQYMGLGTELISAQHRGEATAERQEEAQRYKEQQTLIST